MFKHENNSKSYYDILKINPDSKDKDVRKAYLELARIYHPDNNSGNKKIAALRFRLINEAYATLKKEEGRARYNRLLLMDKGKPKGVNLKADNDNNTSQLNNKTIWDNFIDLFTPSKSMDFIKSSPKKNI